MNRPQIRASLVLAAGAACVGLALLLLTDRPGLVVEFYPNATSLEAGPLFRELGPPRLSGGGELEGKLVSRQIFSLRWRGWLLIEQSGEHLFALLTNQTAHLAIDGEQIVGRDAGDDRRQSRTVWLERGLHEIEIEFRQRSGRGRLALEWSPPGEQMRPLAGRVLLARWPVRLRAAVLRAGRLDAAWKERIGWVLAGVGLLLMSAATRDRSTSIGKARLRVAGLLIRRWTVPAAAGLLLALFVGMGLAVLPFTSPTGDGDDVRYMDAAMFNKKMGWNVNRYTHIYSLKIFMGASGGDAFRGSRLHWSFLFATTVTAMALGIGVCCAGGSLLAVGVAIFLLLCQIELFGGIGLAYADYTAMMLVTVATVTLLLGSRAAPSRPPSLWLLFALGALTTAAVTAKETGLILLWLLPTLLWDAGRFEVRTAGRRLLWWVGGVVTVYVGLMALDGIFLGDVWFRVRPDMLAQAGGLRDAASARSGLSRWAWLTVVANSRSLGWLALLCGLAPLVARLRRSPRAVSMVTLMPAAYLAMMIAIHPAIDSTRYLFPIVPVACLVAAWLVMEVGSGWRERSAHAAARRVLVAAIVLILFGPGIWQTRQSLRRHLVQQQGEAILYPWRQFRTTIETERPKRILVSNRLHRDYGMTGRRLTRERLARLFFRRRQLQIVSAAELRLTEDLAVGDRRDLARLAAAGGDGPLEIEWDAAGQIGLVRTAGNPVAR